MIRVGVLGAAGRMGTTVGAAIAAAGDLELVAAVDPSAAGEPLRLPAAALPVLAVAAGPEALAAAGAEVAVDFTRPEAAMGNLRWCAANGVHAVCGTSGIGPADLDELSELFPAGGPTGCAVVPNFAVGAVLMMHLAAIAAPYMDAAEIVELHHDGKLDAPSGTAAETARRLAAARQAAGRDGWPADRTVAHTVAGCRGGEAGGVRVHSLRLPGLVAHQEVVFGAPGQTLTIRHDTTDRACFVPGVLLAVRSIAARPGLTVGLDAFLGLPVGHPPAPEPGSGQPAASGPKV